MHLRDIYLGIQVTVCVVLLCGSAMMVRTLRGALAMNFGFDPDHAVALRADLATLRFTPAQGRDFQRRLISRIREIPGIEAAALALLTGISLVACVLPARRALRIQPSDALRHE